MSLHKPIRAESESDSEPESESEPEPKPDSKPNPGTNNLADFSLKFNILNWNLINSGLELILYGTRFRIIYSYPANIGN